MNNFICKICGQPFNPMGGHVLKKHGLSSKEYYDKYLKIDSNEGICPICGKETSYSSMINGYKKYCSTKCSNNSQETKSKKEKTFIEHYGGVGWASKELQNKSKQTKLNNYGDENYSNREKAQQTMLDKYGVINNFASNDPDLNGTTTRLEKYGASSIFESDYGKQKIKKTNLDRYGVENVFAAEQIKEKIKETNLERYGTEYYNNRELYKQNNLKKYGVENTSQLDFVKEKQAKTCLEKYGVSSYLQSQDKQIKSKQTSLKKYGVEFPTQSQEIKNKVKETCLEKYGVPWYCMTKKCRNSLNGNNSKPNQLFEEKLIEAGITNYEREFSIGPYSYAFKINNILIEINPSVTHNVNWTPWNKDCGINKNYHRDKSIIAQQAGYRCICIWDWDDIDKVINLIKQKSTYYARKLKIKKISKQEAKIFLDTIHIQGFCKGQSIILGLYDINDNLISLMSFGKSRYNRNYEWELLRYCSIGNVIGGAQKLFKYFIKTYNPKSIISYCDKSKFIGNLYIKLGFKLLIDGQPSCHWSKGSIQITDNLLRQRGFDQLFNTNYGKNTSNYELMLKEGFVQVYDCGQNTYIWTNN